MDQNPKERFENIKKAFYQSGFNSFIQDDVIHTVEVSKNFIKDFEYLIMLVEQMDKRNHVESINKIEKLKTLKDNEIINFIDIIKILCENREKINEIIESEVK